MRDIFKQFLDTVKIVTLAALIVLGVQYASAAWTGPTGTPPTNNVDAPINVSNNSQVKLGELGVNKLTAGYVESIASGFTNTFAGPIQAAAATFSGAVSAASLNAGSGPVTGGQGTFSGGVAVGTSNGTVEYLQLDNKSVLGDPSSAECDTLPEGGRMYYDSSIGILYLCVQGRTNSAEIGWKPVAVEYVPTQQ